MPDDAVNNKGPLSGYRIIDVTQMLSGPMATMILGDQGADVIKIEPPESGDLTRAMGATGAGFRRPSPSSIATSDRSRSISRTIADSRSSSI